MGRFLGLARSKKVVVPESTTVEAGKFYLLGGFFGMAIQSVTTAAGQTAEVVLQAEPGTYETTQITVADAFAVGDKVYWNNTTKLLTTVAAGNIHVGTVVRAKDANNCIWFDLAVAGADEGVMVQGAAQANSVAIDVATIVTDFNALLAKLRAAKIIAT